VIPASFGWRSGTLSGARRLTPSARSLTFRVPGWPGNEAGQHVDVRLTAPDGYRAVRSYSMASVGDGDEVELAVARLPDGEVSPFLVDELELGDRVELRGPLGGFFVWRSGQAQCTQLIAGGSGVVPLVAMVRAHAAADDRAPMQLLYSLRTPADAFYADELGGFTATVPTTWHYTRTPPPGGDRPAGRLTEHDLREQTLPVENEPLIYVCGPTGFVEAVSHQLVSLGHAAASVRTERFGGV